MGPLTTANGCPGTCGFAAAVRMLSGVGTWGAENFHRQDCQYIAVRTSSQIKKSGTCSINRWKYGMSWQKGKSCTRATLHEWC